MKRRGIFCMAATGNPQNGGGWNNQQLLKGCGLVPWLFHKNHGFRAVMVGLKADDCYPYCDNYVRGLELDFLPEDTLQARLDYLDAHTADIDLLMLYGAYPQHMATVAHYKKIRLDGKIYLASDMNTGWAKRIPHEHPKYKKFLTQCDIIGASNSTVQRYMQHAWRIPVNLIRNGFYDFTGTISDDVHKENTILTVGRIGTTQKQNHVLLMAFAAVADKIPDWNVKLVGHVEDNFIRETRLFFDAHPNLRDRIIFTGQITDKQKLLDEYKKAKIFCLTSRFEGTPNAATEALWAGDFVITSAIDAANDITDKGKCGRVFPIGDVDKLAKLLKNICRDEKLLQNGGNHAATYARAEYDESKIVDNLYSILFEENHD